MDDTTTQTGERIVRTTFFMAEDDVDTLFVSSPLVIAARVVAASVAVALTCAILSLV